MDLSKKMQNLIVKRENMNNIKKSEYLLFKE